MSTPSPPPPPDEVHPADDPTHFHGVIPNASATPRNEVGGLALFEGVLMRSRTGFAIAVRRPDGSIHLRQMPFRSLGERRFLGRVPLVRGALSLWEMMVIGTKALRDSTREGIGAPAGGQDPEAESQRMGMLVLTSLVLLIFLLVVLPSLISAALPHGLALMGLIGAEAAGALGKAQAPLLVNALEGIIRLLVIAGYILVISLDGDVRRVFQYHGAEHKAVLALEEGRDVTVARARGHDTLHPRCGTTFLALLAVFGIAVFFLSDLALAALVPAWNEWHGLAQRLAGLTLHILLLPLLIGLCFELIRIAARNQHQRFHRWLLWPGFLLQRLTTRHPDDQQLEVAIVALFGALAIPAWQRKPREWVIRGLEDDESAPGYLPRSPARPAPPPGTEDASTGGEDQFRGSQSPPHELAP